jgi:hypothetical protein
MFSHITLTRIVTSSDKSIQVEAGSYPNPPQHMEIQLVFIFMGPMESKSPSLARLLLIALLKTN